VVQQQRRGARHLTRTAARKKSEGPETFAHGVVGENTLDWFSPRAQIACGVWRSPRTRR
jgi:hypothetical protein